MPKHNHIITGQRLIRYDPVTTSYTEILETLAEGRTEMDADENLVRVRPCSSVAKKILLASPVKMNDKRWETIHFTTAALYLGSALTNAGFDVSFRKIPLPAPSLDLGTPAPDIICLTLFEDLYAETAELLEQLARLYPDALLAAGGPMVSLNPLQTARHLPQLNLLVRGEAEQMLPGLLTAITNNDIPDMQQYKGFLFHTPGPPGLLVISHLDHINRPEDFSGFRFNLDFLEPEQLESGLEINLSRGCGRGCVFCSHVQGRAFRKLPPETFEDLLRGHSPLLLLTPGDFARSIPACTTLGKKGDRRENIKGGRAPRGALNINDDDILQDPDYAETVFEVVKRRGFRLWGVQTSVRSFFKQDHTLDERVAALVSDKDLYVNGAPLVWIGTDAFLPERGKRLGKWIPPETQLKKLAERLAEGDVRHYHYWISSDHGSHWREFAAECRLIYRMHTEYPHFGLLAHAPFVVPYNTTPLYGLLMRRPEYRERIRYRHRLKAGHETLEFPLVERVETAHPHLNRLLDNEPAGGRGMGSADLGFFDYLKQKDFLNVFITLYNFLKQERLAAESAAGPEAGDLLQTEREIEAFISTIF